MSYSIIIAHDARRQGYLDSCLASIEYETWAQPHLDLFIETEGNVSEARNRGAAKARGEILVFLDDDVEVRRGSFEELLEPFNDLRVGIVGGVNVPFPNHDFREEVASVLLSSPLAMLRSASRYVPRGNLRESDEAEILSCFMAIRRKAFIEAGGFPVDIIPCEENVLINQVQSRGYKVLYNPFAVVYHRRPKVFIEYWRTIFHYGKGRGIMLRYGGSLKMVWRPNRKWLYYLLALVGHYVAYFSGLIYGYFKVKK